MPDPGLQEMRVEEALEADRMTGSADQATTKTQDFQAHVSLDSLIMEGLTEDDKKILKELDMDGSGKVELTEILGLLRHHRDDKSHTRKLLKTFLSVVAVLVVILAANTVLTFAVIELSKESKVQTGIVISASTGVIVNTANSEMSVNADGMLIAKDTVTSNNTDTVTSNNAQRLADEGGAIKTTPSLKKVELASSLPDSTLMGLDEVTVHSDKGHTLQIKVHGFSRVPVLNTRCGNIVHFYTAWKGRITLDSTDISFDEATANEFGNAGFGLAVGGVGGRRLAGKIKMDGFFKNMQDVKKSGKWKCAGVPLPTRPVSTIVKQTKYQSCGAKADSTKPKHNYLCDSRYGGFVHGAGLLDKKHALAVVGNIARIRVQLELSTPEVIYAKTRSTTMRSRSYRVTFRVWPSHPGQELITIYDRTSKAKVAFQFGAGTNRSHCTTQSVDMAQKSEDDAFVDKKVDTDMHFELMDTVEEDGKVLRHFRQMTSSDFELYMAGKDSTTVGMTEFWDIADTLQPYRMYDDDLIEWDSISPSCSDSEVEAALAERVTTPIKDLMKCSDAEKGRTFRPTMISSFADLTNDDVHYYTTQFFGTQEDVELLAENENDTSEKANFARYLLRTKNQFAMPDRCYTLCKHAVDKLKTLLAECGDMCGEDGDGGTLSAAMKCLESSGISICVGSEFVSNHVGECILNSVQTSRRLSDWEEDLPRSQPVRETLLPVRTLPDGTQEADLSQSPPHFQAALAQQLGMDSVSSARILFNITEKHNTIYNTGIDSLAESRQLRAWKIDPWVHYWDTGMDASKNYSWDGGELKQVCVGYWEDVCWHVGTGKHLDLVRENWDYETARNEENLMGDHILGAEILHGMAKNIGLTKRVKGLEKVDSFKELFVYWDEAWLNTHEGNWENQQLYAHKTMPERLAAAKCLTETEKYTLDTPSFQREGPIAYTAARRSAYEICITKRLRDHERTVHSNGVMGGTLDKTLTDSHYSHCQNQAESGYTKWYNNNFPRCKAKAKVMCEKQIVDVYEYGHSGEPSDQHTVKEVCEGQGKRCEALGGWDSQCEEQVTECFEINLYEAKKGRYPELRVECERARRWCNMRARGIRHKENKRQAMKKCEEEEKTCFEESVKCGDLETMCDDSITCKKCEDSEIQGQIDHIKNTRETCVQHIFDNKDAVARQAWLDLAFEKCDRKWKEIHYIQKNVERIGWWTRTKFNFKTMTAETRGDTMRREESEMKQSETQQEKEDREYAEKKSDYFRRRKIQDFMIMRRLTETGRRLKTFVAAKTKWNFGDSWDIGETGEGTFTGIKCTDWKEEYCDYASVKNGKDVLPGEPTVLRQCVDGCDQKLCDSWGELNEITYGYLDPASWICMVDIANKEEGDELYMTEEEKIDNMFYKPNKNEKPKELSENERQALILQNRREKEIENRKTIEKYDKLYGSKSYKYGRRYTTSGDTKSVTAKGFYLQDDYNKAHRTTKPTGLTLNAEWMGMLWDNEEHIWKTARPYIATTPGPQEGKTKHWEADNTFHTVNMKHWKLEYCDYAVVSHGHSWDLVNSGQPTVRASPHWFPGVPLCVDNNLSLEVPYSLDGEWWVDIANKDNPYRFEMANGKMYASVDVFSMGHGFSQDEFSGEAVIDGWIQDNQINVDLDTKAEEEKSMRRCQYICNGVRRCQEGCKCGTAEWNGKECGIWEEPRMKEAMVRTEHGTKTIVYKIGEYAEWVNYLRYETPAYKKIKRVYNDMMWDDYHDHLKTWEAENFGPRYGFGDAWSDMKEGLFIPAYPIIKSLIQTVENMKLFKQDFTEYVTENQDDIVIYSAYCDVNTTHVSNSVSREDGRKYCIGVEWLKQCREEETYNLRVQECRHQRWGHEVANQMLELGCKLTMFGAYGTGGDHWEGKGKCSEKPEFCEKQQEKQPGKETSEKEDKALEMMGELARAYVDELLEGLQDTLMDEFGKTMDDAIVVNNFGKGDCSSEKGKRSEMKELVPPVWCVEWEWKDIGFKLKIEWGMIDGYMCVAISCEFCISISLIFNLPPPISADFCTGGEIKVKVQSTCPNIPVTMTGKIFFSLDLKFDKFGQSWQLAKLTLTGVIEPAVAKNELACIEFHWEGMGRRRFWLSRRREPKRLCFYHEECDVLFIGTIELEILIFKATLKFKYYIYGEVLTITVQFAIWKFWLPDPDYEDVYSEEVYKEDFRTDHVVEVDLGGMMTRQEYMNWNRYTGKAHLVEEYLNPTGSALSGPTDNFIGRKGDTEVLLRTLQGRIFTEAYRENKEVQLADGTMGKLDVWNQRTFTRSLNIDNRGIWDQGIVDDYKAVRNHFLDQDCELAACSVFGRCGEYQWYMERCTEAPPSEAVVAAAAATHQRVYDPQGRNTLPF